MVPTQMLQFRAACPVVGGRDVNGASTAFVIKSEKA